MVSTFSCVIVVSDLCYPLALQSEQDTATLHLGKFITLFFTLYYCGTNTCRDTVMVSHHNNTIGKAV